MAKNSEAAYGAEGRGNILYFDPDNLVLVEDKTSPLYDPRVHLAVSEPMVLNIMHQGVLQAISVAKNPETGQTEVVAGRQRVKAAREANKRLKAAGCEPVRVPALPRVVKGEDRIKLMGVMVSENEVRQDDTPLGRLDKMTRLLETGHTNKDLAVLFGCTVATVKNTLSLANCTKKVRKAVDDGKINVTAGYTLSKEEPETQDEMLEEMLEAGEGETGNAKAKKVKKVTAKGPVMRGKKEITEMFGLLKNKDQREALEWVLGADIELI